tara:strand:- start:228 stop:539 length:312 start_codon:yes stop_codon:yes gene_type:complete
MRARSTQKEVHVLLDEIKKLTGTKSRAKVYTEVVRPCEKRVKELSGEETITISPHRYASWAVSWFGQPDKNSDGVNVPWFWKVITSEQIANFPEQIAEKVKVK